MRHFFQSAGPASDGSIVLDAGEAHHAAQVIRLQAGDRAVVLDGRGGEYACEVRAVSRREVRLQVEQVRRHESPSCRVRLVQAITKGKSFELILQKAVELGAAEIVPLLTERVVARPASHEFADKQTKWQQLAVEALKQCGAKWLPRIFPPMPAASVVALDQQTSLVLVAALSADARHMRATFEEFIVHHGRPPESISMWIGPEGDFSPAELEFVLRAGGRPVSLGSQVLRSETAAIYALSVLGYELGSPRLMPRD